jgi:predicted acyl esterase
MGEESLRRVALSILLIACSSTVVGARAQPVCQETPRVPANPFFTAQEQSFGFHDEEVVICSPGYNDPTHIAARLWVPSGCPGVGGCPGVLIQHQGGTNKELTIGEMFNAVGRGLYVLAYDQRGEGTSGGQHSFLTRQDVADQAAVLEWLHRNVRPTKTASYGISGGGWLALAAGIFNCGSARAAKYDSTVSCDRGRRWVDAIVPIEAPTPWTFDKDGTCDVSFATSAFVETRGYPGFLPVAARCATDGTPAQPAAPALDHAITARIGPMDLTSRLGRIDVPVYLATSFADRTVPPVNVTRAYEFFRAREKKRGASERRDVRLLISNDDHGGISGNTAAVDDIFTWVDRVLRGKAPQRAAPVSIAQPWAGDAFRLERDWPIPGTKPLKLYLLRATDSEGALTAGKPRGREPADELQNLPMISSPPFAPGIEEVWPGTSGVPLPGLRLDYATPALKSTWEVTNVPEVSLWVSSANQQGDGRGQIHATLSELRPDGSMVEFAHGRVGLRGLGPRARKVIVPLSVSGYRIPRGSRLALAITASDAFAVMPTAGDPLFVHHGRGAPSFLNLPLAPLNRVPPKGKPPSGVSYADDPVGTICSTFSLPC